MGNFQLDFLEGGGGGVNVLDFPWNVLDFFLATKQGLSYQYAMFVCLLRPEIMSWKKRTPDEP